MMLHTTNHRWWLTANYFISKSWSTLSVYRKRYKRYENDENVFHLHFKKRVETWKSTQSVQYFIKRHLPKLFVKLTLVQKWDILGRISYSVV